MKLHTWHLEALVVWSVLTGALFLFGKAVDWREWMALLGVGFGFHYASISNRLEEAQLALQRHASTNPISTAHHVECVRWLGRYWWLKEAAWVAYFLSTRAVSALIGCAVFLVYPLWRRWYRGRYPVR